MATPLYKRFKEDGSTIYVFPGASEDIASSYQNENYKMNFSKFALLNLDITPDSMNINNDPINPNFPTESNATFTDNADRLVNSLRNYVANHETVLRESLINNNNHFYDPNKLRTTTQRIFFKWLRKTGAIQFEPATPGNEYIDASEFQINENLPEDYFKEILWKERSNQQYRIENITYQSTTDNYKITFASHTNFIPDDIIILKSDPANSNALGLDSDKEYHFKISSVSSSGDLKNNIVETDSRKTENDTNPPNNIVNINWINGSAVTAQLNYNKVIQYIGEINSINNVQEANKSYTEVLAYVPHQAGKTPDILFQLVSDRNYAPGQEFPILPTQEQSEILGAEDSDSPIIQNPENYPGDHFAQFDRGINYLNSTGFENRRRGEYFGIPDVTDRRIPRVSSTPYVYPEYDGSQLDGIELDFDPTHYTKMNIPNNEASNFDEFNSLAINNEPPEDFEFNTILWFYEVEDLTSEENNKAVNLYGIQFLNNVNKEEPDPLKRDIPTFPKRVTNSQQDGLSYKVSLNLNFNINNENFVDDFDPERVYSLFGFDLFNEVMRRVAQTNETFTQIIGEFGNLKNDIQNIKSQIFSQTEIRDINNRIDSLSELLNQYKSLQIKNTDSIIKELDESTSPPQLSLRSVDPRFGDIKQYFTTQMYSDQTNQPQNVTLSVPQGKDFMVTLINDDQNDIPFESKTLNFVLEKDLHYRQSCVFKIWGQNASINKGLKISINSSLTPQELRQPEGVPLVKNIELPVDLNTNPNQELEGIEKRWNTIPSHFLIENVFIEKISDQFFLILQIHKIYINSFDFGDHILLENFLIEYPTGQSLDLSSQKTVASEPNLSDDSKFTELRFSMQNEVSANELFTSLSQGGSRRNIPVEYFTQPPFIRINTGWEISIMAKDREGQSLQEKYLIEINKLKRNEI